jgi:CheY-like chemotaxis protein
VPITLSVSDTGVGIDPQMLPRLFERFTQADSSTSRRFGGTGLGLAISREIVQLMGGRIEADSRPGAGSVFRLQLELEMAQAQDASADTAVASAHAPLTPLRPLRVLVAEDNAVNQILIRALLAKLGHHHDIVADGAEALRQVQAARYDVVLMDVQMPHMDGIAATRAIRALPGDVARVPVVAMTANVMTEDRDACVAAGMTGFVGKPIDRRRLHAAIERAARGAVTAIHTAGP